VNRRWAEISLQFPSPLADEVADRLTELTGSGVTLDNRQVDTFSIDTIREEPLTTIRCYLADDESLAAGMAAIRDYAATLAGAPEPELRFLQDEDWSSSWKAHFKPARIGRRLVIKPTWETFEAGPEDLVMEMDPGMAFGTGTHPTTRLCLESLEDMADGRNEFAGFSPGTATTVLDVGTGSGVLAMAAVLLMGCRADAIDIDEDAVGVARANIDANGLLGPIAVSATPLAELTGPYGIIIANIIAEELVRLAEDLIRPLAPGGGLLLSGILQERLHLVTERFAAAGLTLLAVRRCEEWCSVAYRRDWT
jgi:ribosomal protein L11 methyltransferase